MTDDRFDEIGEKYPIQSYNVSTRRKMIAKFLKEIPQTEQIEVLTMLLAPSLQDANAHFELRQFERSLK